VGDTVYKDGKLDYPLGKHADFDDRHIRHYTILFIAVRGGLERHSLQGTKTLLWPSHIYLCV